MGARWAGERQNSIFDENTIKSLHSMLVYQVVSIGQFSVIGQFWDALNF